MFGLGLSLNKRFPKQGISSGIAPVNTVVNVISGDTTIGSTLTTTNGTFTGTAPITYTYQWQRGGAAISGATNNTYTTVNADIGEDITCEVTATNAFGSDTATSNTIIVLALKLQNSLLFNGVDEYIDTAKANINTNIVAGSNLEFAILLFFKIPNAANSIAIFNLYNDTSNGCFRVNPGTAGNKPRLLYTPSVGGVRQLISNDNVNTNNAWCHVVFNVKTVASSSKVFVNGVDQTATNQIVNETYGMGTLGTTWRIGEATGVYFSGNIAQIALIKRNLTPTEITNLYNVGCPRLVGDIISAADIEFKLEDNYSWNGTNIVGTKGMTSTNMVAADITTTTPC